MRITAFHLLFSLPATQIHGMSRSKPNPLALVRTEPLRRVIHPAELFSLPPFQGLSTTGSMQHVHGAEAPDAKQRRE